MEGEDWESTSLGEMSPFEDNDDNVVLVISYTESEDSKRQPPPVVTVEIEDTVTSALIDTGASVNLMDTAML